MLLEKGSVDRYIEDEQNRSNEKIPEVGPKKCPSGKHMENHGETTAKSAYCEFS